MKRNLCLLAMLWPILYMCLEARGQRPDVSGPAPSVNILTGTVSTAVTNQPIEGASIRISDTESWAFTDKDGTFKIASGEIEGELLVSYMGYKTKQVPIQDGRLKNNPIRLKRDLSKVTPLTVGDSIPDYLWDLPVSVVNHPRGRSVITLREYQSKELLVLDFWAKWCAPCVKSLKKWEAIQPQYTGELSVLSVHMDFADKALPFIRQMGWSLPALVGENYDIINRHFFNRYQVGGVVWIWEGKIAAIAYSTENAENIQLLPQLLSGKAVNLQSTELNTYQQKNATP